MNETRWYYSNDNNEVVGPVTPNGLKALLASGEITWTTLVCQEGTESWIAFSDVFSPPPPVRPVPVAVVRTAPAPTFTPTAKPATDPAAAKGRTGCLVAIGVGFIFLCAIIISMIKHPTPYSPSSTSTTSPAWNIGYSDGQSAGRADARQRNSKAGYNTRRTEATRHSAPLAPTGLSRKDYEEGWSVGYSSGYDSYSK